MALHTKREIGNSGKGTLNRFLVPKLTTELFVIVYCTEVIPGRCVPLSHDPNFVVPCVSSYGTSPFALDLRLKPEQAVLPVLRWPCPRRSKPASAYALGPIINAGQAPGNDPK